MKINARRGTVATPTRLPNRWFDRLIAVFVCILASVIVIGYLSFFSSSETNESDPSPAAGTGATDVIVPLRGSDNGAARGSNGAKATIGYAITVTGCPKHDGSRGDFGAGITDGAAVLQHSIHMNSIRGGGGSAAAKRSKYDYQLYALVHPEAEECGRTLEPLGYRVLIRDVPVPLSEIEGDHLRTKVASNGCCGEKEFVKLHAYALTEHPAVVHMDLDTLVLQPMDALFDAIVDGPPADGSSGGVPVAFDDPLVSGPIDAFFTRDYNMNHRGMKHAGVQGGFLVLRPSMKVYYEFVSIVRKGDFRAKGGWGGMGFGPFYGSMTFQGIIPYYYDALHPGTGVELNHCVYNNMADNPRDKPTKNDIVDGSCRDGYNRPDKHDKCEDCRSRPFDEVVTTHFTLCQKPWECLPLDQDRIQSRLCSKLHAEWYRIREDLETSVWGREKYYGEDVSKRGGRYKPEHFRGYCKSHGGNGYVRINVPGKDERT